jgi:putative ABC transport system substrate-binding protein
MKRREFVSLIGAAMVWPTAAFAQQRSAPKIGFLYTGSQQAGAPRLEAFLSGLRTVGVSASAQIEIVFRTTDGDPSRIIPLMEEIVRQNPDAIFANGPAVVQAARATTQRIPILALDLETDPVGNGFAASIAHPGGNVSGLFLTFRTSLKNGWSCYGRPIAIFPRWPFCGTQSPDRPSEPRSSRWLDH